MLRLSTFGAVLLLALSTVPSSHGATVVFCDTEFLAADWDLTIFWTLGSGGRVDAWQSLSGGHPGAFRTILNLVNNAPPYCAVAGFHRHLASVYDPAQGAILTIDYAEDAIMLIGAGQGQGAGPALRQDGQVFVAGLFITPETTWTAHELEGLTAADFHLEGQPDIHPDFSTSGGVIEFGFVRQNSTYSGGYVILGGIDNWTMILNTETPVGAERATWSGVKALFQ